MDEELIEEKLDNPLVVHKESDASYQETASEVSMSFTHTEEDTDVPTLERHRFKKKKKDKKWPWILVGLIAVGAAVCIALYYNGFFKLDTSENETTTRKSYITQKENKFEGIITVKSTYIFFEGKEVDGISGLMKEIKYLDAGTKFIVQDEKADSNFLNLDVLPILEQYDIQYEVKHIASSGLMAEKELTTQTTTAKSETTSQAAQSAENQ